jgi:hypothetical protein
MSLTFLPCISTIQTPCFNFNAGEPSNLYDTYTPVGTFLIRSNAASYGSCIIAPDHPIIFVVSFP